MNGGNNRLLEKNDFAHMSRIPAWLQRAYHDWCIKVDDSNFPCHFGVAAQRAGHLRYTYMEKDDFSSLPNTLSAFLVLSKKYPNRMHALVLFVEPEEPTKDFDYYNDYFWEILSKLHENDTVPWPEDLPMDPNDPNWEFVYNGEPIFVSANAPFYQKRITRNLGQSLILIFQPRRIFANISHTSPTGQRAIQQIRAKVEQIEQIPAHPDLGGYGDPTKREWKQYVLTDSCEPIQGRCPMTFKTKLKYNHKD